MGIYFSLLLRTFSRLRLDKTGGDVVYMCIPFLIAFFFLFIQPKRKKQRQRTFLSYSFVSTYNRNVVRCLVAVFLLIEFSVFFLSFVILTLIQRGPRIFFHSFSVRVCLHTLFSWRRIE
jgi:hypothetical protein